MYYIVKYKVMLMNWKGMSNYKSSTDLYKGSFFCREKKALIKDHEDIRK